jgi:cell wall-associated NlpC family hydrolase
MDLNKALKYYLPIAVLFFGITSCINEGIESLDTRISEIGEKYVPDHRTGIFELHIRPAGKKQIIVKGETTESEARDSIFDVIAKTGYEVVDSLEVLPSFLLGDETRGIVCVSVANIRTKPSHPSELSTQAVMGTPLEILKRDRGWLMVRTPDRYIGWTNDSSVEIMTESDLARWNSENRIIFTGRYGTVDAVDGSQVSDLVSGSILVAEEMEKEIYGVRLPDGRKGFTLSKDWIVFDTWADTIVPRGSSIVASALRFTGIPYMWGGTSSKSFDCSGYTKTVYFLNGLILERDASQQIKHGLIVPAETNFNQLQPGDLLFFGSKTPYRVIHTGIWIGNHQVIHASGMVKIESVVSSDKPYSQYLTETYLETRRLIGQHSLSGIVRIKDHPWYIN